jgi:hypothetical protein
MSEVPDRLIEYDELEHLRTRKIWSQTSSHTPPCEQEACLAVLLPRAAVFTAGQPSHQAGMPLDIAINALQTKSLSRRYPNLPWTN